MPDEYFKKLLRSLEASLNSLPDKPEETPESTLRALWFFAAGQPKSAGLAGSGELPQLSETQEENLEQLINSRIQGIPLAYITGRQEFMGLEFISAPGAMIPRKETEILAAAALRVVRRLDDGRETIHILDLCTGSGNLAVLLALQSRACRVVGVDISPEALDLARRNAGFHGVEDRAGFIAGDLFQPFKDQPADGKFDLIVCNPPYISSANVEKMPAEISRHEPRLAFDGGPFGLNTPWRLAREAPAFMNAGGWLCFEVGKGQGKQILSTLQKNQAYEVVEAHLDGDGEIRALTAHAA